MIVSVVTVDGLSDDSCHVVLDPQSTVYLRIAVEEKQTAFHYSINGQQYWHLVKWEARAFLLCFLIWSFRFACSKVFAAKMQSNSGWESSHPPEKEPNLRLNS